MEHQRGEFHVRPVNAIDRKDQTIRINISERVVYDGAIDAYPFLANQRPAALARAKAVFLQESFELHGRDATIAAMQFEHLIAINDPGNPLIIPLSREQLWAGLMHRVENPLPFLPGLENFKIVEHEDNSLLRDLNFGAAVIQDRVTLVESAWVRFDILPSEQHAGGSLTITIEEPNPGHLFLRFAYATTFGNNPNSEDRAYVEYVKSAYHQSDVDCVRIIRTLAAGGTPQ